MAALALIACATPVTAAQRWKPPAGTSFAIILSVAPDRVTTSAHAVDLDLFEIKPRVVRALKQQGKRVICYMSAGSWENWRPDRNDFPKSVIGKPLAGWPGERYLDIRKIAQLAPIMRARLDRCKEKGFDAVDPDNVDSWMADTGFPLTKADAVRYLRFLAREAHKRGLAIGLKNATEVTRDVIDLFDFAVTEDCFDQGWCPVSRSFTKRNKAVFAIEYTDNRINFTNFCKQARQYRLSPLLKKRNLDEWERRCP